MNNVIKFPVIAGVEIKTDDEQRFNLNALHQASGLGRSKTPSKWLSNQSTKDLINELDIQNPNLGSALKVNNGGSNQGTFAHELLAISYAGWISPKFQLQVNQTFIDYKKGEFQPNQLSRFDILKIAMQAEEENLKLTAQVEEMSPQVEALNRIASFSDGSLCITNAAKHLQIRPKDLFAWLSENKWIYKRTGGAGWIAYQDKLQQGLLEHKVTVVSRTDGSEKTTEQVRITSKGLAKLAILIKTLAA
jgi:phage antirepressor YoqD-like protein